MADVALKQGSRLDLRQREAQSASYQPVLQRSSRLSDATSCFELLSCYRKAELGMHETTFCARPVHCAATGSKHLAAIVPKALADRRHAVQRASTTMRRTTKGKKNASSAASVWYGPDRPMFLGPFSEEACPPYLNGALSCCCACIAQDARCTGCMYLLSFMGSALLVAC